MRDEGDLSLFAPERSTIPVIGPIEELTAISLLRMTGW
jgi:hypothetical protein